MVCPHIDAQRVKRVVEEVGAQAVATDAIYDVPADIFAPCALGAVLNDDTVPRLKVEIVAGGANKQPAEDRHRDPLQQRHTTLAPGYLINRGGLINVNAQLPSLGPQRSPP